jgi:hypothetical protein
MLLEVAKPVAFLLCVLSLLAVFHTAFFAPGTLDVLGPGPALQNRIFNSLLMLGLSAAISIVSGLLFQESSPHPRPRLSATLPLQLFLWTTAAILLLFPLSCYLEAHYVFTPSIHW